MSQQELDSAVAQATGESVRTIRRRGFSLVSPTFMEFDPDPEVPPQIVDWDALDAQRSAA